MESEPLSTNTFEFPRRYCRGLLLVGAGQVEASAVIGWCASAPPLPLRLASPAQEGSSRDLPLRNASVRVSWLSAGTRPAPGAAFPALSSLTRPSLFRGGSHSWAESPVERRTGAETLLSASGPKRCPVSWSFTPTTTPLLRLPRSSLPSVGRMWQEMLVHRATFSPATSSKISVLCLELPFVPLFYP